MDNFFDLDNIIENSRNSIINTVDSNLTNIQNKFLNTDIGNVVDNAINIGLKSILPDFIEDQIINIKDSIFQNGLKAGIDEAISSSIDLGKSAIGIFSGNFENISQIQNAIKKGGLIDSINSLLDKAIEFAIDSGVIDKNIGKVISSGKKTFFKSINDSIENNLENQVKTIEKLDKYCEMWHNAYKSQNLEEMKKDFKNINKVLEKIVPLENVINKAREIENLQTLIENNGENFDLSSNVFELAKIL